MQNITHRDNITPLHRGVAPLRTDPASITAIPTLLGLTVLRGIVSSLNEWMRATGSPPSSYSFHEYQPHRLTFGERLVIHFGINGDFYTGILLGGVVVSLIICAAATLIAHVRLG
jgi:hypothetical protein